ncbi:MAG: hypothetical protein PHP98_04610 [Kiritimatiellae bacterium]|nr:hypothetical protein [Kiritimatiellia bacterium]
MRTLNGKYIMRICLLVWLWPLAFLQAEPAGVINYQGRLLDKYGRRVNSPVEIIFRIFNGGKEPLWSEKHDSIPVKDGLYSTTLGSQTPLPASIFEDDELYFEICINGETLSPRQRITASPYALTARTVSGPDLYVAPNGRVGIGTQTPSEKLDVKGAIQVAGFKMPAGAAAGYVLVSDAAGAGRWQAVLPGDAGITNWANEVFSPATNDLWAAVNARVAASAYSIATGNLWTAVGRRVFIADYSAATGEIWNAISMRLPVSGGVMSGPLTNNAGFFGDGAGLTNIQVVVTDTAAVHKAGDSMTGPLIVSNNLSVSGRVIWDPGNQTIYDNNTTIQVARAFTRIGTDGTLRDFAGCALQIAPGAAGQALIIQATNSCVRLSDGKGLKLAEGVNFYMSTNDLIQFIYDGSNWVEIRRTDNDDHYRP